MPWTATGPCSSSSSTGVPTAEASVRMKTPAASISRELKPRRLRGVVVAAGEHDPGPGRGQPGQGLVGEPDGVDVGQRPVVDVAGDDDEVDPLGVDDLEQVVDVGRLVREHPLPVERPAEVPVGGVEDAHASNLGGATDSPAHPRRRTPGRSRSHGRGRAGSGLRCSGRSAAAEVKPYSARPLSRASWTERLVGAPTRDQRADTGGDRPSAPARSRRGRSPRGRRRRGSRPASTRAPVTLSTALCRPTSSRTTSRVPSGVEQPGRVHAAGAGEDGLALAQHVRAGGVRRRASGSGAGPRGRAAPTSSAAVDAVLAADTARRRARGLRGVPVARVARPAAPASVTVTTLNSCSGARSTSVQ